MKILIYGAGVIGSVYAAKLHEAGQNVTLLARGSHYDDLKQNGVIIRNILTGKRTINHIPLTRQLETNDFYDLIIVTVRLDQLEGVLPALKNNIASSLILFMLNNPENKEAVTQELNGKHFILGFPGVGGTYQNNCIDYLPIKQQQTTIGEINGEISESLKKIKTLFEAAGFEVAVSNNIQAWLKTHAVFVTCVSAAIAMEDGDSVQLGKNRNSVKIMVKSIHEGFGACKALGLPISPSNLKIIFMIMPEWISISYWQKALQGEIGTLAIAPHATAAKNEMQLLAKKVLSLVHSSDVTTPTLDSLLSSFVRNE
jgi:2-dehydropantoate 2-reductase